MDLPERLQGALQRLNGALDALDAAVARRAEVEASRGDADAEFLVLQDDRSRLALDLDTALARIRALDRTVDEVSERLDRAGATVRGIVAELAGAAAEPGGPA